MQKLLQIQAATLAARERLNDVQISTRCDNGMLQVGRADTSQLNIDFAALTDWISIDSTIAFLNAM